MPLATRMRHNSGDPDTHLDQWLGNLEEVLLALGSRTLTRPVQDRLIADAVGIVQNLVNRETVGHCSATAT